MFISHVWLFAWKCGSRSTWLSFLSSTHGAKWRKYWWKWSRPGSLMWNVSLASDCLSMIGALALYYMFYFEHWKLFLKNLKGFWNMTINCSGLGRTPRTTLVNKDRGQFLPTSLLLGVCSHAAPVLSISRTSHEAQLPQQPPTHPPQGTWTPSHNFNPCLAFKCLPLVYGEFDHNMTFV